MPVIIQPGATNTDKSIVLWDNVLNRATLIQDTRTDPNHPSINARMDEATWSRWAVNVPLGLSGYFRVDCGSSVSVSCVGVSAHDIASSGAVFRLHYSNDGITWTDLPGHSPLTDDDFIILFGSVTARYWQVSVVNAGASIGVVFLGSPLVFPHTPIDSYTPLHHARKYTKTFNDSIKGHFLGNRVMSSGAETDVDFGFVDRPWSDGPLRGFEDHYNKGRTFFYASAPSKYPLDMGYCRARGDDETMAVEYIEADKMSSLSFGVRAFVGT